MVQNRSRWFLQHIASGKFLGRDCGHVGREEAELYDRGMADTLAFQFARAHSETVLKVVEATDSEVMSRIGRRGGRANTPLQNRARRRNASKPRPSRRVGRFGSRSSA